jgi:curved DNA-binding protein CbpA
MPTAARAALLAVMDAYKVLGVDYSADSTAIRQAHKRLAKQYHPDRFPVGSAEQEQATAHMAAINDAYGLIRKAPLRYHRVSEASDPTTPSTDTELDDAIRRAPMNQDVDRWMMDVERVDRWMTIALVVPVVAMLVFTGSVAVFKTRTPLAIHVPQAALRQPGPLLRSSTEAIIKKIGAQELESQLIQSSGYLADAKLRCEPKTAGWDYICSYTPTDQPVFRRLHFGVNVDSQGMRQISRTVPLGVPIPPAGL